MRQILLLIIILMISATLHSQELREKREGKYVGLVNTEGKVVIPLKYDKIFDRYGKAIIAEKDDKVGILSRDNKVIIPLEYESFYYGDRYYWLSKNNKYGLFNEDGIQVLPCKYDRIKVYEEDSDYFLVVENGKSGLIDNEEKQMFDFREEKLTFITKDYIQVENPESSLVGVIDLSGQDILPIQYRSIEPALTSNTFIVNKEIGKYGVVDVNNKEIIPFKFAKLKPLDDDTYLAIEDLTYSKNGVVDALGNVLVPFKYDKINTLTNGLRQVSIDRKHYGYINRENEFVIEPIYSFYSFESPKVMILEKISNEKWVVVDLEGNQLTEHDEYDYYDYSFDLELFILAREGKARLVNKDLSFASTTIYDFLEFGENEAIIASKEGKWGYINKEGTEIVPLIYEDVITLSTETRAFLKNGKWVVMDNSGKITSEEIFDEIIKDEYPHHNIARKGKYYGIIDRWGSVVEDFKFDEIRRNAHADLDAKLKGKWGLFTIPLTGNGQLVNVIPFEYDSISLKVGNYMWSYNGFFVQKNGKWGKLTKNYEIEIPLEYDEFIEADTESVTCYYAIKNNKYGVLIRDRDNYTDKPFSIIIPVNYDKIELISLGHRQSGEAIFKVSQNSKWGLLDQAGETLLACEYDEINLEKENIDTLAYQPVEVPCRKNDEWIKVKISMKNEREI